MKKIYIIGLCLSTLIGIWHFFVPYLYQWSSYIPSEYKTLIVGIEWTNFFFSLFLTGYSILLIIFKNNIFNKNKELFIMYGFMVVIWFCRLAITFIHPWPLEPIAWVAYGQQIVTFVIFSLIIMPFINILRKKSE